MPNERRPRLLITGISGFLGPALCQAVSGEWEVYGTVHREAPAIPGLRAAALDLLRYEDVRRLFEEIRPDAVLHAAALSKPEFCQTHPEESERVNVTASAELAGLSADRGIPFVFTSTDMVFDGEHAPYAEGSPANPVNVYGEHKVRAEQAIRGRYPEAVICRLPLLVGPRSGAAAGFFANMASALERGERVALFTDEVRTPVTSATVAAGLASALTKAKGVTIHLGGRQRVTRWELGRMVAEVAGLDTSLLTPCLQKDARTKAPRARDVSLISTLAAETLGYRPDDLRTQIERALKSTSLPRS